MPASSVRRPKDKRWVEAFVVSYSTDGKLWQYYSDETGQAKVLYNFHVINELLRLTINVLNSKIVFYVMHNFILCIHNRLSTALCEINYVKLSYKSFSNHVVISYRYLLVIMT